MYSQYRWCTANCPFFRSQQNTEQQYADMRAMAQPRPVTVTTKEIRSQNPGLQVDLKMPEIRGILNKNVERTINNSIQSDVIEFRRQMEEAAKENVEKSTAAGRRVVPYVVSAVYELTYNKHNIMSLSMVYNELINGRHSYIKVPYNFDTVTGGSLSLKDLFRPGVDYRSLINKEVRRQLLQNREKYFPGTAENFKGVAEDQPFYLQNGHLVVFFGFHEIAPTEAGLPVFRIPLSNFRNEIKPILLRN
jgi:hypothetical protein